MFLTYQHAKIDQFGLFVEDPHAWTYVEHSIHRPWFYVTTVTTGDDFAVYPMLMLSNDQLLGSLLDEEASGLRVESVMLVSPDHVNRSGRWMMEPLESIERLESPEGVAYAYQVLGNKTYIYGNVEIAQQKSTKRSTLFSVSMLDDKNL